MKPEDNFDSQPHELLDSIIAARQSGQDPANLIAHLPAERQAELLALCELAASAAELTPVEPPRDALPRALARLHEEGPAQHRLRESRPLRRVLAWAASIVLAVVLAGGVSFAVSESSVPGELLYPVKRASESVRMFLIRNPEGRAEFCVCMSERRLQELIATAREHSVNPALLNSMLAATRRAYREVETLPAAARDEMMLRVGHACGYQRDALTALRGWVPERDTLLLAAAIRECMQRWESCCGGGCWCDPDACLPTEPGTHTYRP